jgi:hypothetical protein
VCLYANMLGGEGTPIHTSFVGDMDDVHGVLSVATAMITTSLEVVTALATDMHVPGRVHPSMVTPDLMRFIWAQLRARCLVGGAGASASLCFVLRRAFVCHLGAASELPMAAPVLGSPDLAEWVCSCESATPFFDALLRAVPNDAIAHAKPRMASASAARRMSAEVCRACADAHAEMVHATVEEDTRLPWTRFPEAARVLAARAASLGPGDVCVAAGPGVLGVPLATRGDVVAAVDALFSAIAAPTGPRLTTWEAGNTRWLTSPAGPRLALVATLVNMRPSVQCIGAWRGVCQTLVTPREHPLHVLATWNMSILALVVLWGALHEAREGELVHEATLKSWLVFEPPPFASFSMAALKSGCAHPRLDGMYFDGCLFGDTEHVLIPEDTPEGSRRVSAISTACGVLASVVAPWVTSRMWDAMALVVEHPGVAQEPAAPSPSPDIPTQEICPL